MLANLNPLWKTVQRMFILDAYINLDDDASDCVS